MKSCLPTVFAIVLPLLAIQPGHAAEPNYVPTGMFQSSDPLTIYTITDFNNQRMVCGEWRRFSAGFSSEVDRGIFIWRDGAMRHIDPGSGGLPFSRASEGIVKMTNVRPDGTLLLIADARQPHVAPSGPTEIIRVIRYTIEGDLATYPQPVVSAVALGGFLDPNISPPDNVELSAAGIDVTEDGYVLGQSSSPFFYAPTLLWGPEGGHSGRWFSTELFRTWGNLTGFDRAGHVFGSVSDLNEPPISFRYESPLLGLTLNGGASQVIFPETVPWAASEDPGGGESSGVRAVAMHGPFRAATPGSSPYQTAVWSTGFINRTVLPNFRIVDGLAIGPNGRTALTTTGHMLGERRAQVNGLGSETATAIRTANGTYEIKTVNGQLADGYELLSPFRDALAQPVPVPHVVAINDGLDWLVLFNGLNGSVGNGFHVFQNLPSPGKFIVGSLQATEFGNAQISFRRIGGNSGAARLRVTFSTGGTASPGTDFTPGTTGVIQWADGEDGVKTIGLPVLNDYEVEDTETIRLTVSEVQGATYDNVAPVDVPLYSDDIALPAVPAVSSAATASGTVGDSFIYTATATETGANWLATGLPPGLEINPLFGHIEGFPQVAGTFIATLRCGNDTHASAPFTLTCMIAQRPAGDTVYVTSPRTATARVGQPFTYTFTVNGTFDSRLAIWGNPPEGVFDLLPPGFSFNASTGVLSGTPGAALTGPLLIGLVVDRGSQSANAQLMIEIAPATGPRTPLQRWLAAAGKADTPPLADEDGNTLPALLEYAFGVPPGTRPLSPVSAPGGFAPYGPGLPVFGKDSANGFGNDRDCIYYYRSREAVANGATFTAEFTSDFVTWASNSGGQVMSQDSTGHVIKVADPAPGPLVGSRRFFRLKITQP